jgi:3-phenylpropionate/trans-cinnamate dioxygenase ferredoxin reductase component
MARGRRPDDAVRMTEKPLSDQTFVIVGASLTGAKAAETLRTEGFEGRLVLIGAEDERPYERPPLSKGYLRGEAVRDRIYVHAESFYAEHDIELQLGRTVTRVDTEDRVLTLEDGMPMTFDRLLLATGAEPRRLAVAGAGLDGVHHLRSVADADALRERFQTAESIVVVGAGWIGSEVAASARACGLAVTIIDPLAVPLERVLGREVGAIYRDLHSAHGVQMLMATTVEAFEGERAVERVRTRDGRTIDCDLVVVGIGVQPRTELAAAARLRVDDGILVDRYLETSRPGIFAAGDVAKAHHPAHAQWIRVEHWANALNQGRVAARNMLGRAQVYDRVPYFFSDQYDVGMEYSGFARTWDHVVFRGDPAGHEFVAFWLAGHRVVAGMSVNVWDVTDPIQDLIRERVAVRDAQLADPDFPLADLATELTGHLA